MREDNPSSVCPNCGTPLEGRYCVDCGQEARDLDLSLRDLLHEFFGNVMSFDSRVWRTAVPLLFRPGDLTARYLAGQRVRFVPPVRLYLFVSIIYFLLLAWLGPETEMMRGTGGAPESGGIPDDVEVPDILTGAMGDPERFRQGLLQGLSYLMFFLVPVFGGLVGLVYRNRGRPYLHHLLFALHLHAFVFVVLIAGVFLELSGLRLLGEEAGELLMLLIPIYLFLALGRVYGGRWWATLLRLGVLGTTYLLVLSLSVAAMALGLIVLMR